MTLLQQDGGSPHCHSAIRAESPGLRDHGSGMPERGLTLGHFAPVTLIPLDLFVLEKIRDIFMFNLCLNFCRSPTGSQHTVLFTGLLDPSPSWGSLGRI